MKKGTMIFMILAGGILGACGGKQDQIQETGQSGETGTSEIVIEISGDRQETERTRASESDSGAGRETAETEVSDQEETDAGDGRIAGQTFEVELSEYEGKVLFVPYAPSEENPDFHMEIIQDEKILTTIPGYVPEKLAGEDFVSLDAVSFYDMNYDGFTDLVLIETYGNTSFASVYYGFDKEAEEDYDRYFSPRWNLSEAITREALVLSVPGIRDLMSGGKKNGQFADYKEAYEAVARLCRLDGGDEITYSLVYFDEDQIPELAADQKGYYISLYTYKDGTVSVLMDKWSYGAMGNAGYEYAPGKNSLRNYNTDYAGAILHTTYMSKTEKNTLETRARIDIYNFDDVNGNGIPDENETGSMGLYSKIYVNGEEAADEEWKTYDMGEYEILTGDMSFEELKIKLSGEN